MRTHLVDCVLAIPAARPGTRVTHTKNFRKAFRFEASNEVFRCGPPDEVFRFAPSRPQGHPKGSLFRFGAPNEDFRAWWGPWLEADFFEGTWKTMVRFQT